MSRSRDSVNALVAEMNSSSYASLPVYDTQETKSLINKIENYRLLSEKAWFNREFAMDAAQLREIKKNASHPYSPPNPRYNIGKPKSSYKEFSQQSDLAEAIATEREKRLRNAPKREAFYEKLNEQREVNRKSNFLIHAIEESQEVEQQQLKEQLKERINDAAKKTAESEAQDVLELFGEKNIETHNSKNGVTLELLANAESEAAQQVADTLNNIEEYDEKVTRIREQAAQKSKLAKKLADFNNNPGIKTVNNIQTNIDKYKSRLDSISEYKKADLTNLKGMMTKEQLEQLPTKGKISSAVDHLNGYFANPETKFLGSKKIASGIKRLNEHFLNKETNAATDAARSILGAEQKMVSAKLTNAENILKKIDEGQLDRRELNWLYNSGHKNLDAAENAVERFSQKKSRLAEQKAAAAKGFHWKGKAAAAATLLGLGAIIGNMFSGGHRSNAELYNPNPQYYS